MLEVKQLNVSVEGREILRDVNLNIGTGETHALLGLMAAARLPCS